MKIKWINCNGLILILFLLNILKANKIQFSAEIPDEIINFEHQDLWHPHLKRRWLDNKNYVIFAI